MNNQIEIRKATEEDFSEIMEIYAYARKTMQDNGNKTQWGNTRPDAATIHKDISLSQLYVIEQQQTIHGVFAFIIGADPTYNLIELGEWKDNSEYGTIHRIAGDGKIKGIFDITMQFCEQKMKHIRIDTHKDNTIMQHLIEKHGFEKCGIIYASDNTPRLAYEKHAIYHISQK